MLMSQRPHGQSLLGFILYSDVVNLYEAFGKHILANKAIYESNLMWVYVQYQELYRNSKIISFNIKLYYSELQHYILKYNF